MSIIERADERTVLVVDDEMSIRESISRGLALHGFQCATAANSRQALALIREHPPAVIISDISMPGESGVWLLQEVKREWPETSVLMLTALDETQTAVNCLMHGADNYIIKPVQLGELAVAVGKVLEKRQLLIENKEYQRNLELLVEERTDDLRKALTQLTRSYAMTLKALVASLDAREHQTGRHSQRVSRYSIILARGMKVKSRLLQHISKGAILHDIGKLGIPDAVLLKNGPLSPEEWVLMKRHPQIGHAILKDIDFLEQALEVVLCHHEQYDGKGYPKGLAGDAIPLSARIFHVIDAFDTMTSGRPYRNAISFEESFEEIRRCSGTHFDPAVVKCFFDIPAERWHAVRQLTK